MFPESPLASLKTEKLVLAKGYGVTNIKTQQKTDANTLFGIASNSKAFTISGLGNAGRRRQSFPLG
jgi:CubicO group peptidase (beta-lactamase class C family)